MRAHFFAALAMVLVGSAVSRAESDYPVHLEFTDEAGTRLEVDYRARPDERGGIRYVDAVDIRVAVTDPSIADNTPVSVHLQNLFHGTLLDQETDVEVPLQRRARGVYSGKLDQVIPLHGEKVHGHRELTAEQVFHVRLNQSVLHAAIGADLHALGRKSRGLR